MFNNIFDIRHYSFSSQDKLLLDTNVWLHIYADKTNPSSITKIYSQAFERMLSAKSLLFVDTIIFTEFISNYVRLKNNKQAKKFKIFRNSEGFTVVAKEAADIAHNLLRHCQRINYDFCLLNTESLLNDFSHNHLDIKDQIILKICETENLILVTDDSDFRNSRCKILSANAQLIYS